ncbi:MAG: A/G-specific adenine glycosylase [Alphaproteobacteria bacterium]|nr:A/G-specific adenine glycosylase [Alphaproteobacteria bacterium]
MPTNLTNQLLDWYAQNGRELPWRVKGGAHFDPYAVWISEIMLQQTTVATVTDYFIRWMKKFPDVKILAKADLQEVLLAWQGLGYYTRARKIHECAHVLTEKYKGEIPVNREELLKLPGIGPYTASSICCFAFNQPETVVDGNVMRVIARLRGITKEITAPEIYPLAQELTSETHGADYASAIMDLGATVCTPTNPKCAICPWIKSCIAYKKRIQEQIPQIKKLAKKEKFGQLYLIQNKDGAYLIRKRSAKGLLAGLWEFPWEEIPALSKEKLPRVVHVFTHFKLTLELIRAPKKANDFPDGIWVNPCNFNQYPFPTLMQKVIKKL